MGGGTGRNMLSRLEINNQKYFFNVLLTVHFSILILVICQIDAKNFCFTISLFRTLYMFRAHVLIIRRSKLHYTACGIITPIGGRLVHRLREEDNEHMCSKHVEATK